MKKLTDYQIQEMELFARERRKAGFSSADERHIVEKIERHQSNDWSGIRIKETEKVVDMDSARAELERLKRKVR